MKLSVRVFAPFFLLAHAVLAAPDPPTSSNRVEQVIVVCKTHFDIGYTDFASNVVMKYRTTMIDEALRVLDESRRRPREQQFIWTIPGWPLTRIAEAWPGHDPARRTQVLDAFRQGRFVVHALPFTTHTELLEPEDLVRGLGFSSALSRQHGHPLPRDAKMTDVPSHSWILPTLLRHAGVDFLHLGCNAASRSPAVPPLFWWEGPDGSRVLTMYSAEAYGTGLVPPADWPHRTWLALLHTGDNHGPPTSAEVQSILDQASRKLPGVRVRFGRLSDFADAIIAEQPVLPVVRGDMPDTWIHGPMSDPAGAALARRVRPAIAMADHLGTCVEAWGVPGWDRAPAVSAIARARENSLLYGEHTWGGAFWWIYGRYIQKYGDDWQADRTAGRFQRIENSWDEHSAYIHAARQDIEPVLADELAALARAVQAAGPRLVVHNPSPWKRSGVVTVRTTNHFDAVRPADGGRPIAVERGSQGMTFIAADLPPMGYRTFVAAASPAPATRAGARADRAAATLENEFFRVKLDPVRGGAASVVDRRSNREWVDASAPQRFGQYLYERFDRDQVQRFVDDYVKIRAEWGTNELGKPSLPPAADAPYVAASPRATSLRFEESPISVSAELRAPAGHGVPHAVTTRWTLYAGQPWIELAVTVHAKPADPWPEAGWICLPFKIETPQFRLGRLGGIVDPARDLVPGANVHLFALHSGMTVTDPAGHGAGLCPLDSPLVSLGEPGAWRYSPSFTARAPRIYINLFNNQWTTNFRLWNSGTWTSRVRLWSVAGADAARALITPAEETRRPLTAAFADGPAGTLPLRQHGLAFSQPGLGVSDFGLNPDGPGHVLRVWEGAGQSGRFTVQLPPNFAATEAQPVDLRGRPIGPPIAVRDGRFASSVAAFAPAGFRLQTAQTEREAHAALSRQIRDDRDLDDVLQRARALLKTGFNAGSGYREVWIRDFATFIELSCAVADRAEVRDNLLMFLRLQGDDGNIIDGVVHQSQANVGYQYIKKPGLEYWGHKNTVETDQETSLIQAVHTYIKATGDRALLEETVDGRRVLDRLEDALGFLLKHRFDRRRGLLWGATTVDWGDVQPEHSWGVVLDASSHRAIDVYDNAMFIIALRNLAELAGADVPRARRWTRLADDIHRHVRRHLWDARARKFLPHVYLDGSPFPPDLNENAMHYHGGTAVAILAGLLSREETIETLRQMRANVRAAGAGTIGLTVYPPYPAGTFKNEGMRPWSYQNGGDWDWFGGRMIQALVQQGLIEDAYLELLPMVRRVQQSGGFFEWFDRQNNPRGSGTFRGSAGVLARAILALWAAPAEADH